jgi:hypothetical protein
MGAKASACGMEILPGRFAFLRAGFDGAFEDDRFPHAPRLDPLRAALGKFEAARPRSRKRRRQPKPTSARGDNRRPRVRLKPLA